MDNSFSDTLKDFNGKLDPNIQKELNRIKVIVHENKIRIVAGKNDAIGIVFNLRVNRPSRSTSNGIDIRELEPIIVTFSPEYFLYEAPKVYSDRKDFPAASLPHLNPASRDQPANFCLHQGDINQWYSEHSLYDLIIRVSNWLDDASSGNLIKLEAGDHFEITRVTKSIGQHVFDEELFEGLISEEPRSRFICSEQKEYRHHKQDVQTSISSYIIDDIKIKDVVKQCKEFNSQKDTETLKNIGLLLNPEDLEPKSEYIGHVPLNVLELRDLCSRFDLDLDGALENLQSEKALLTNYLPVTITIVRPALLLGSESKFEFINFRITLKEEGSIKDEDLVECLQHRKILSFKMAKEISGLSLDQIKKKTVFFGAGAVGSKVILHIAKSGYSNYEIVDNDTVSPHNLVRFGLLGDIVGQFKTTALSEEIQSLFKKEKSSLNVTDIPINGMKYLSIPSKIEEIGRIIDCTASNAFAYFLADSFKSKSKQVFRCEIAKGGSLGILKKEGLSRSPRLDDLNIYLLDRGIDDPYISTWLKENVQNKEMKRFEYEDLTIGIGCNSVTLKLSDDVISLHSAYFSIGIKRLSKMDEGVIQLLKVEADNNITTETIVVPSFRDVRFKNNQVWRIRINSDIYNQLLQEYSTNKPNETGGLLVGRIDPRRNLVYITRNIGAPSDSIKKPYLFTRGVDQVPEILQNIRQKTGDTIDYVGEWHTHPNDSTVLSSTDMDAVNELREKLDKIPYPTIIILVTKNKITPYIFGPESITHFKKI
jgi:integrative and conjugative element protein (TIGR02256 family)